MMILSKILSIIMITVLMIIMINNNNGKDLCNNNYNIELTKARVIIQRVVITIMTMKVITLVMIMIKKILTCMIGI